MKKTSKFLSAVLAALMLTVAFPISAFAGTEEGTLPGDSTVKDVTVVALVPSTLAFALDPLELDATQGSQVQNANYFFVNKTEAPVLVQLDLTATTATGVTLVSDPATLSPYDTTVKTKDIYFGVLGATAVADGDLAFDYVLGTTGKTDPVGTFSSTTSPLSVFDPTTKSTKVAFALAKATDLLTTDTNPADTLAASDKGVADFQFFGNLNTYAKWAAKDITVSGAYTLTALSATTYSNYTKDGAYITSGLNQLKTDVAVTGLTVSGAGSATSVVAGGTLKMSAVAAPSAATNTAVTWSVAPLSGGAATIDTDGTLHATTAGTVTVTATAKDGSGIVGTLPITITAAPIAVSGITVTGAGSATTVTAGGTLQMSAAVLPSDATDPSVTWSVATLSGGAASISASGLLSATTAGTVTVTATNAASGKTGTLVVTVNSVVAVTALAVTGAKSATSVVTGSTLQMSSTPTPSNASDSSVTWSIAAGGTGTATINATSGVLSATGVGTVTVKATNAASGVVGTQTVTIYSAVGFIPTSGTTTTTTLATKVASVKTSTADINVPFCFNGLTITKIDYNGVMDFATSQYAAVGNNLVLYKTVAPTTLAGASAGDRTLTITLSNGLTYAFTVTIS